MWHVCMAVISMYFMTAENKTLIRQKMMTMVRLQTMVYKCFDKCRHRPPSRYELDT